MWKLLLWFLRPGYQEQRAQEHLARRERGNGGVVVVLGLFFGGPLVLLASWGVAGNGYVALAATFVLVAVVPAVVSNAAGRAVGFFGPLHSQRAARVALFCTYALLILGALAVLKLSGAVMTDAAPATAAPAARP
jgi:hypothetical protein